MKNLNKNSMVQNLSYCKCCDSYGFCKSDFRRLGDEVNIFKKWDFSEQYAESKVDAIYYEKDYCFILVEFKNCRWFLKNTYSVCLSEINKKISDTLNYFYKNNCLPQNENIYRCLSYDMNDPPYSESLVKRDVLSKIKTFYSKFDETEIKFGDCKKVYHYCHSIIYKK